MRKSTMFKWLKVCLAGAFILSVGMTSFAEDKAKDNKKKRRSPSEIRAERAKEKRLNTVWKSMEPVEGFEPTEFFDAVKAGDIKIVFKTVSSSDANLFVTNQTDRPLAIKMPPAFAGVPILRQGFGGGGGGFGGGGRGGGGFGGGGRGGGGGGFGGGGGQGGGGGGGGGQGGGGFGGGGGGCGGGRGGGGRGGGGLGGGAFNIPPGRVGKAQFKTFCLEHGKTDPRPQMKYTLAPIEVLSKDPKVFELCRMIANDELTQNVAQASAWNLANELSWEFLLTKNRIERMDGSYERYFNPNELLRAQRVVQEVTFRADETAKNKKDTRSTKEIIEAELNGEGK